MIIDGGEEVVLDCLVGEDFWSYIIPPCGCRNLDVAGAYAEAYDRWLDTLSRHLNHT